MPDQLDNEDELDILIKKTYWDKNKIARVLASLSDASPQIILQGPPGTGKTFVAKEIARYGADVSKFVPALVQLALKRKYSDLQDPLRTW
jgi:SpoVK/Ycf46/Vps4 family AAA+-type ATPase